MDKGFRSKGKGGKKNSDIRQQSRLSHNSIHLCPRAWGRTSSACALRGALVEEVGTMFGGLIDERWGRKRWMGPRSWRSRYRGGR